MDEKGALRAETDDCTKLIELKTDRKEGKNIRTKTMCNFRPLWHTEKPTLKILRRALKHRISYGGGSRVEHMYHVHTKVMKTGSLHHWEFTLKRSEENEHIEILGFKYGFRKLQ